MPESREGSTIAEDPVVQKYNKKYDELNDPLRKPELLSLQELETEVTKSKSEAQSALDDVNSIINASSSYDRKSNAYGKLVIQVEVIFKFINRLAGRANHVASAVAEKANDGGVAHQNALEAELFVSTVNTQISEKLLNMKFPPESGSTPAQ